jgi:hypothetical protein
MKSRNTETDRFRRSSSKIIAGRDPTSQLNLSGDDVREGLTAVISVKLWPQDSPRCFRVAIRCMGTKPKFAEQGQAD